MDHSPAIQRGFAAAMLAMTLTAAADDRFDADAGAGREADDVRTVYVGTGEQGEPSFSDVATPGARPVALTVPPPPDGAVAELQQRIEQTLTVANALEQSRLARERTRAQARAEAQAVQSNTAPQVVYQDRFADYPYVLQPDYRRPGRWQDEAGWHPPRPDRPPPDRPSEGSRSAAFPYQAD